MADTIAFGEAVFEPKARLLKLLGGELIRDDVMAIVELIKNSHDADATHVRISFEDVTGPDGVIIVTDNGTGMTVDALLNHWMQPAGSSKKLNGRRSPKGRRYLGEKGVGRFAVDRLGRFCELISRAKGAETEIVASIDWDAFDNDEAFLSDITTAWKNRRATRLSKQGTIIHIGGLRQAWNARSFRKLSSRLARLISPFENEGDGLKIEIASDEFPDYAGELGNPYFNAAPYRLIARYDGGEHVDIEFNGEAERVVWPGPGNLTCGPIELSLHAFDLETDAIKSVGSIQDVRAWLREWSGFSVYRDGFRVLPYGEPDDDWLRLDARRVNNPVFRLSNNQIVGLAAITADSNSGLTDQTNRLGLNHSREYEDFRKLTQWILSILEERRQKIRNPAVKTVESIDPAPSEVSVDSILGQLRAYAPKASKNTDFALARSLDELERAYRREKTFLLNEVERHVELAAFGHNVGFLASSIRPVLYEIKREATRDYKAAEKAPSTQLDELVERALHQLELVDIARSVVRESKREIDLVKETRLFGETAQDIARSMTDLKTSVFVDYPADGFILAAGRRDLYWQILTTLLQNSLQAMARSKRREIRIRVKLSKSGRHAVVSFKDTGSGIPVNMVQRIFEVEFSTRKNFRGMGLPIARTLAGEMAGCLEYRTLPRDKRQGFTTFELTLPLSPLMKRP